MTETQAKTLYLIDGSGFIFRAFYALPPLTRPDGTPINAVLGFTNMILSLMDSLSAHYIAVVFDSKRKNFRHDLYPEYKANRSAPPDELIPQFPLMREACQAFQIPILEQDGFEADDLIASYTKQALQEGFNVVIVSSDKDLMQLVSDKVVLFDQMKNTYVHPQQVLEKFQVFPDKVLDILALAGDSSDNIPGVPGIGPKTAATLIQEFGSFDQLFANLDKIKQPKRRQALEDHKGLAYLSRQLVTLRDDIAPLRDLMTLQQGAIQPDVLEQFLLQQGFKSIQARLQKTGPSNSTAPKTASPVLPENPVKNYEGVFDLEGVRDWIRKIYKTGYVAFDTETSSLNVHTAELVGLSLAIAPGEACYIPMGHVKQGELLQLTPCPEQLDRQAVLDLLKPVMEDPAILKIAHNAKFDMHMLNYNGIQVAPVDDTIILSALLEPGSRALDELVLRHFNHEMIPFKSLVDSKQAKTFADVSVNEAIQYGAEDADYTLRLWLLYKKKLLAQKCFTAYYTVDRPLIPRLLDMEKRGIMVNAAFLKKLGTDFDKQLHTLEETIFQSVGQSFNLGSPKQLGEILFDVLQIPGGKKGKSGSYATGADVLEKLAFEGHSFVEKILDWRQYSKLKTTYVEGLLKEIHPTTQRVHTNYTLFMTSTGRLSSTNPNLQNIPIRTEVGRQIRQAFVPMQGYKLVSLDYSQIELRLLAHMAQIPVLQEAFRSNLDIHRLTASQVFGVEYEAITKDQRRKAKAINFGIIYGISGFGLARQLDVSVSEANTYIKLYKEQYPGITDYMTRTIDQARQDGLVRTLFGRPCYVPNILSKNPTLRNYAERQAINAPLQGSNADIIKRAMIQVPWFLRQKQFEAHMLLQVHDELVFEVLSEQVDDFIREAKALMAGQAQISVPLVVDAGVGDNWAEAH